MRKMRLREVQQHVQSIAHKWKSLVQTYMGLRPERPVPITTAGCSSKLAAATCTSWPSHVSLLISYPTCVSSTCTYTHTHTQLCWSTHCFQNMLAFALLKLFLKCPSLPPHWFGLSHPQSSYPNSAFSMRLPTFSRAE